MLKEQKFKDLISVIVGSAIGIAYATVMISYFANKLQKPDLTLGLLVGTIIGFLGSSLCCKQHDIQIEKGTAG